MPTLMQRRAVKAMMVEKGRTKGSIMKEAGYSKAMQKAPTKLTNSKGYFEVLNELGLTKELITCSLVEDINAKPHKRVPELTLGANILRMTQDNPNVEPKIVINAIFE